MREQEQVEEKRNEKNEKKKGRKRKKMFILTNEAKETKWKSGRKG